MGPGLPGPRGSVRATKAVVVPHAGYIFSGRCASFAFKAIAEEPKPEAYIIIGPDHYGNGYPISMSTEEYWTPFGECGVAWDIAAELGNDIPDVPSAHVREHSIEVELPFLKYVDSDAKIVPIIMSDQSRESADWLSSILAPVCERHDVLVIASSDLVHYVSRSEAQASDSEFLSAVSSLDVDLMYHCVLDKKMTVCGYGPIAVAVQSVRPAECEIMCQTDSSESGYGTDRVVGYGAARMY